MQSFKSGKRSSRNLLAAFLLLCALIAMFCFQYYFKLQDTIRDESRGYLEEVSSQISSKIDRIIYDNYAVLNGLADVMKVSQPQSFKEMIPIVEKQKNYWSYENIMLIDAAGMAYSFDGSEIQLSADASLLATLVEGEQSFSTTQMINGNERIIFAIPLLDHAVGAKDIIALAASYNPNSFNDVLSMTSFGGQAYSQIIDRSGAIITRPTLETAIRSGYNVLTSLADARFDSDDTLDKIRNAISMGVTGQTSFILAGEHRYMSYTPLDVSSWSLLTFVPVSAVNARSDMLLRITVLICGVITLVFAGIFAFLVYTFHRNKQTLERIAFVDELTEGNTLQRFYILAAEALAQQNRPPYALIFSNLSKFKVLNDQFGRDVGDAVICEFHDIVMDDLQNKECIGRYGADNFCILLESMDESALISRFIAWQSRAEHFILETNPVWALPVAEMGIFFVEDDGLSFPQMIDRAKLALRKSPQMVNSKLRYAIYDDAVSRGLVREKELEDMMEAAMESGEFQMYLQPKYRLPDAVIDGAEALTRWVSKTGGMIFPDEFIPLFEKNGFIIQLDLWIFEEACRTLRRWIDTGRKPVKISVNCSRLHLREREFLRPYRELMRKYSIPRGLLEIELTESIVMEDVGHLTTVINEIHAAGLGCSMDDFGSGYSSLNLIRSIPVDTLKLDKIFFRSVDEDPMRMESVVKSIVGMAKALSMRTVAEGVEKTEQVEMLCRVGCDYIQGYVFARPVPVPAFEAMAFEKISEGGE